MRDTLEENVMVSKLIEKIQKTKAPICVGLDPMLGYIPEHVKEKAFAEFGETLEGAAEAIWQFNCAIVDATADLIPAVKPQIAMYEQFGIEGLKAYDRTVKYCQQKGLIVIGDIKRGDIGSTSAAYATGHLGSVKVGNTTYSAFNTEYVTVNPYLGTDGVKPFVDECNASDRGIFVLVKTSNPSSGEFQDRLVDGRPLYELVAEKVVEWGEASMDGDYSNVGAVVGATYPEMSKILRKLMPKTYFLVPGYGAQGGTAEDLKYWTGRDRQFFPRYHRSIQERRIRQIRSGAFCGRIETGCHRYDCGHRTRTVRRSSWHRRKRQQLYIVRKNWHLAFSVCGS